MAQTQPISAHELASLNREIALSLSCVQTPTEKRHPWLPKSQAPKTQRIVYHPVDAFSRATGSLHEEAVRLRAARGEWVCNPQYSSVQSPSAARGVSEYQSPPSPISAARFRKARRTVGLSPTIHDMLEPPQLFKLLRTGCDANRVRATLCLCDPGAVLQVYRRTLGRDLGETRDFHILRKPGSTRTTITIDLDEGDVGRVLLIRATGNGRTQTATLSGVINKQQVSKENSGPNDVDSAEKFTKAQPQVTLDPAALAYKRRAYANAKWSLEPQPAISNKSDIENSGNTLGGGPSFWGSLWSTDEDNDESQHKPNFLSKPELQTESEYEYESESEEEHQSVQAETSKFNLCISDTYQAPQDVKTTQNTSQILKQVQTPQNYVVTESTGDSSQIVKQQQDEALQKQISDQIQSIPEEEHQNGIQKNDRSLPKKDDNQSVVKSSDNIPEENQNKSQNEPAKNSVQAEPPDIKSNLPQQQGIEKPVGATEKDKKVDNDGLTPFQRRMAMFMRK